MRRFALGLGLALVLGLTSSAMAQETLVILNSGNGYLDELEPGVFLSRKPSTGFGPLFGTNVLFACGSCEVASFAGQLVTRLGGAGRPCGPAVRPIDIVLGGILLCIKSTESEQLYDFNLLSWTSAGGFPTGPTPGGSCIDADGGTTCATTGNNAAYIRAPFAIDPLGLLEQLIQDLVALDLPKGSEQSLMAKLDGAWKKLSDSDPDNDGAAINKLQAFVNNVEAQSGKKIDEDDAEDLVDAAQAIIAALLAL